MGIDRHHVPTLAMLGARWVGGYREAIMSAARRKPGPIRPGDLVPVPHNPMPPPPVEGGLIAEWS